jgi:hypothetical protein
VCEPDLIKIQRRTLFDKYPAHDMHKLVEVYEEIRPYLSSVLRLDKILNDLGMGEQEIINVLNLATSHQLKHLQWKVEYLRKDIDMLAAQKAKCSNHILILNRRIDKFRQTLNNSSNFSQSNASWYSVDISYSPMNRLYYSKSKKKL